MKSCSSYSPGQATRLSTWAIKVARAKPQTARVLTFDTIQHLHFIISTAKHHVHKRLGNVWLWALSYGKDNHDADMSTVFWSALVPWMDFKIQLLATDQPSTTCPTRYLAPRPAKDQSSTSLSGSLTSFPRISSFLRCHWRSCSRRNFHHVRLLTTLPSRNCQLERAAATSGPLHCTYKVFTASLPSNRLGLTLCITTLCWTSCFLAVNICLIRSFGIVIIDWDYTAIHQSTRCHRGRRQRWEA